MLRVEIFRRPDCLSCSALGLDFPGLCRPSPLKDAAPELGESDGRYMWLFFHFFFDCVFFFAVFFLVWFELRPTLCNTAPYMVTGGTAAFAPYP